MEYKHVITINQRAAVELGLDLDIIDLAIFDYIKSSALSSKCMKVKTEDGSFYWISHKNIQDAMPLINIKSSQGIINRIKKLIDAGLLIKYSKCEEFGKTLYAFGPNYDRIEFFDTPQKILMGASTKVEGNNKLNNKYNIVSSNDDTVSPIGDTLGSIGINNKEENNNSITTPYNPPSQELTLLEGEQPIMRSTPKQYSWLVDFWNDKTAGAFKPITCIQGKRLDSVRARLKEYGYEQFKNAIIRATQSDFLKGAGRQGFVANFDWLIKPNNFPKVLEGNYDNNTLTTQTQNDYARESFNREIARQQGQAAARAAALDACIRAGINAANTERGFAPEY